MDHQFRGIIRDVAAMALDAMGSGPILPGSPSSGWSLVCREVEDVVQHLHGILRAALGDPLRIWSQEIRMDSTRLNVEEFDILNDEQTWRREFQHFKNRKPIHG